MKNPLRKAVFPVAGLGTRFLPATKASPKEMLPIVDKPLIQYAVEEAAAAGITDMVFVTGRTKGAIEDHFDSALELESDLAAKGKHELLDLAQSVLPPGCRCMYIRQSEPLGLGHAVLCARPIVGNEPFAVVLADDLIAGDPPELRSMAELYAAEQCSVVGVVDVPRDQTASYGIVVPADAKAPITPITGIVEKPEPASAPSTLAVVGRYVLTPAIFDLLADAKPGRGGEIQLTDAIARLLSSERVLARRLHGRRFDCGSRIGLVEATIQYALDHDDLNEATRAYMRAALDG